jgi:hypothetical protein
MSKSSARGTSTSAETQVLGLTPHALWILVGDREFMLDFTRFPWFARASIEDVSELKLLHGAHLHWPRLDVDLHIDSVEHPERFPLVSRKKTSGARVGSPGDLRRKRSGRPSRSEGTRRSGRRPR